MKLRLWVAGAALFVGCSGGTSPLQSSEQDAGTVDVPDDAGSSSDAGDLSDVHRPITDAAGGDSAPACTAYPAAAGTSTKCAPLGMTAACAAACGGYAYGYECADEDGPAKITTIRLSAPKYEADGGLTQGIYCGATNVCVRHSYVDQACGLNPNNVATSELTGWVCPAGYAQTNPDLACASGNLSTTGQSFTPNTDPPDDTALCCQSDQSP